MAGHKLSFEERQRRSERAKKLRAEGKLGTREQSAKGGRSYSRRRTQREREIAALLADCTEGELILVSELLVSLIRMVRGSNSVIPGHAAQASDESGGPDDPSRTGGDPGRPDNG